jgi:hypothetical protein
MKRKRVLVRFVPNYTGSPAWMPREEAERYLEQYDKLWFDMKEIGALTEDQLEKRPYIQYFGS